jgi:roadblock/LC7 domain-containing protein
MWATLAGGQLMKVVNLTGFTVLSKINFAPFAGLEIGVTQVFVLFFSNYFLFVYRHSDLGGLCSNGT